MKNRVYLHYFFLFLLLFPVLTSTLHCAPSKPVILYPSTTPPSEGTGKVARDRYAFLTIIDGGRLSEIDRLVKEGKLPTIKRLFYDNGAVFTKTTTVYPTLSMPAHQAIMTGITPGNHGLPDLTWLDRANEKVVDYLSLAGHERMNSDLLNTHLAHVKRPAFSDVPHTIFEALSKEPTFSSYEMFFSGAKEVYPPSLLAPFFKAIVEKRPEEMDLDAIGGVISHWQQSENFPRFTSLACYGFDELTHAYTASGDRVLTLYQGLDRGFADLEKTAKARGVFDKMTWVLTADHGQHQTAKKVLKLADWFEKRGISAQDGRILRGNQIEIAARDVGNAEVYIRKDGHFKSRLDFEQISQMKISEAGRTVPLLDALRKAEGVQFLVMRKNAHTIRIIDSSSEADIAALSYDGEPFISYTPLTEGKDPLHYLSEETMRDQFTPGDFYSSTFFQKISGDARYPDALSALSGLLLAPDAADILLITDPDYNMLAEKPSNHGSLEKEDMRVPLLFSGPDIQKGTYDIARTVDIYPTLLKIFGIEEDPSLYDGHALTEALIHLPDNPKKTADTASKLTLAHLENFFSQNLDYARLIDKSATHEAAKKIVGNKNPSALLAMTGVELASMNQALHRLDTWTKKIKIDRFSQETEQMKQNRLLYLFTSEREKIEARMANINTMRNYLRSLDYHAHSSL